MGVSIHYRGQLMDIQKEKLDFIDRKISAVSAELARVTRGHIEHFSGDEFASMIEALLHDKFSVED